MSDLGAPPPGSIPWILGAVSGVVLALWAALRSAVAKNEARLEAALAASVAERARERAESEALAARLGAALDAERAARLDDAKRTAALLLRGRQGPEAPPEWAEAPTGVRQLLEIYAAPRAGRREPSDPPLPPRGRLPSRPR